jgi:hypothetical protein
MTRTSILAAAAALCALPLFAAPIHLDARAAKSFEATLEIDLSTRAAWAHATTNPKAHYRDRYRYLISAAGGSSEFAKARLADPTLFKNQGVSLSLIDQAHSEVFGFAGYIMDVPADCIFAAGPDDLGTANRAWETGNQGAFKSDVDQAAQAAALAAAKNSAWLELKMTPDSKLPEITKYTNLWKSRFTRGKQKLETPDQVLKNTLPVHYNEIFATGTSLDGTKHISPIAGYVFIEEDTARHEQRPLATPEQIAAINAVAEKLKIPVVHLYRKKGAPLPPKMAK